MRHNVRVNWQQELKADAYAEEFGITKRLFRKTLCYKLNFWNWDYPPRSYGAGARTWKAYRKHQYREKTND